MAREISVTRLVSTAFVALSIVLCASSASHFAAEAAPAGRNSGNKKGANNNKIVIDEDEVREGGKGASRLPGTLPNGAPRKIPELDTLSVTLPFSLRRNAGVSHIVDVAQSHAPGAFCEPRSIADGTCDATTNTAESATRSRLSFHQQQADGSSIPETGVAAAEGAGAPSTPYFDKENSGLTLQHILDANDEAFLVYIYDSLDANSYRSATALKRFANELSLSVNRMIIAFGTCARRL